MLRKAVGRKAWAVESGPEWVLTLVPWAVAFRQLPAESGHLLAAMGFFLAVLTVGFVYAWKRGALEWA